jgi:cytochrome c553
MKSKRLSAPFTLILLCTVSSTIAIADEPFMANALAGKTKSVLCSGCHGLQGEGKHKTDEQPAYPGLAGQVPDYFIKSVRDYKNDIRNDPIMNAITKGLTDIDIANLAAYYAALK